MPASQYGDFMRRLILLSTLAISSACFSDPPSTSSGADDDGTTGDSPTTSTGSEDDDDDDDEPDASTGGASSGEFESTGAFESSSTGGEGADESSGGEAREGVSLIDRVCMAMWLDTGANLVTCPSGDLLGTPGSVFPLPDFPLPPPDNGTAAALAIQPPTGNQALMQGTWTVGPEWGELGTAEFLADGICVTTPPGSECSLQIQLRLFRNNEEQASALLPLTQGPPSALEFNFNNVEFMEGDELILIVVNAEDGGVNEGAVLVEPRIVFD